MSTVYNIDESVIFDRVDEVLASLDIGTLELVRQNLIEKNEDTSIIDKVIEDKKRRNQNIDNGLMSWEEDLVKKCEYEPFHFEEENMEEDDYYYEDE